VLIKVLQHDVLMANQARFCTSSTSFHMLRVLYLRPSILAKFANNWLSWTNFLMSLKEFRHNHLTAEWAFFFFVKLFLIYYSVYVMLLLIFDIDHFLTVFTFANVATAIGLMEVNSINWESLVAVTAFLIFTFHFSYYSNILLF
jgi:hypothetical protein